MFKAIWAVAITCGVLYSLYPQKAPEEVTITSCTLVRESAYRQRLECKLSDGRIIHPYWVMQTRGNSLNCYGKSAEGCYGH